MSKLSGLFKKAKDACVDACVMHGAIMAGDKEALEQVMKKRQSKTQEKPEVQ